MIYKMFLSFFSCSDTSVSCHRFLDLSGPLYIGGLPTNNNILTDTNSFNYRQFDGCIRNLYIDMVAIDLSSYHQMDGRNINAGCNRLNDHCSSIHTNVCKNNGKCQSTWYDYKCQCSSTTTGRNCTKCKTSDQLIVTNYIYSN
jgi:cadherin EGF LAG seven-pass G-type receptor 1